MTEAVELLRELATKLGTTVEVLWPSAVRYVAVSAASTVVGWAIWLLAIGGLLYSFRNLAWVTQDGHPTLKLFTAVLFVLSLVFGLTVITHSVPNLIEPTGAVVYSILN